MSLSLRRFSFRAMANYCEIQIYDESRITAKKATQRLASEILRIEQKYFPSTKNSFVLEINNSAGNRLGIKLDAETRSLFNIAEHSFELSSGTWDITATKLTNAWKDETQHPSDNSKLTKLLPLVGFEKLGFKGTRLYLPKNMEIDFGPIIKEYAADAVAELARKLGVHHGLINLGGDFTIIGPQPDQKPWCIGVANPENANSLLAKIELLEGGIASCGDFSSFRNIDNLKYNSLVNAKTGWLCSGLRAATVASLKCTQAGSLARMALALGEDDGLKELEEQCFKFVAMTEDGDLKGKGVDIN